MKFTTLLLLILIGITIASIGYAVGIIYPRYCQYYFDNDPLLNLERSARDFESSPIREIEEVKETQDSDELQLTTDRGAFKIVSATITAYCLKGIMASGKKVYRGAVACHRSIPLGTKLRIGDVIGYVCEDRLSKRYDDGRFDIWIFPCSEALEFGIQYIDVQILK